MTSLRNYKEQTLQDKAILVAMASKNIMANENILATKFVTKVADLATSCWQTQACSLLIISLYLIVTD